MIKEMLKIRKEVKSRKPTFLRKDSHKKKRLSKGWRRPKGITNKKRLKLKAHGKNVSQGYGSPKVVKGFSISGLNQILVRNLKDLAKVTGSGKGIIISRTSSNKTRVSIIQEALKKSITIINIKNGQAYFQFVNMTFGYSFEHVLYVSNISEA